MNKSKPNSINGPWHLKEYQRSMFYIFDVKNNDDKLIARFVADDETKDDLKAIPELIVAAPELLEMAKEAQDYLKEFPEESLGKYLGYELECVIKKAKGADK